MPEDARVTTGSYKEVAQEVREFVRLHQGERFDLDVICRQLTATKRETRKYVAIELKELTDQGKLEKLVSKSRIPIYRVIDNTLRIIDWVNAKADVVVPINWPYSHIDESRFGFDGYTVVHEGDLIVVAGVTNAGKGHPHGTPILTKDGWVNIEELERGQDVFGRDGQLHVVTGIYHRGLQPCHRFIFNDRTFLDVDADHLWTIRKTWGRKTFSWLTRSTKQIIESYGTFEKNTKNRIEIPMCEPLQFPRKSVPISGYIVGLLLGDGCLANGTPSF